MVSTPRCKILPRQRAICPHGNHQQTRESVLVVARLSAERLSFLSIPLQIMLKILEEEFPGTPSKTKCRAELFVAPTVALVNQMAANITLN